MSRCASLRPLQALSIAVIGAMTTGCYTTTLIPPSQATRLGADGLTFAGEARAVRDTSGEMVVLGESFSAKIEPRPGLPPEWATWGATAPSIRSPMAVEVRGPMLVMQGENDPRVTQVPLAYVQQIRVREYSHGKTAALAIGATAGTALVILGGLFLVFVSHVRE